MTKIILDTSFIVHCAFYKVDFISELDRLFGKYSLFIIDKTFEELSKLSKNANKFKASAKLARAILDTIKPKQINSKKYVDDAIIDEISKSNEKYLVATHDDELKRRLIKKKTGIILLRQKSYLEIFLSL